MRHLIDAFRNAFNFSGRANRKQYWIFFFMNILAAMIWGFISGFAGGMLGFNGHAMAMLYPLASLLPAISLSVRRVHDSDHRFWWMFVPLYNIYLIFARGTNGANRFGEVPAA